MRILRRKAKMLFLFQGVINVVMIFGKNKVSRFTTDEKRVIFHQAYLEALEIFPKATRSIDIKTSFGVVRIYEFLPKVKTHNTPIVFFHGHYASSLMWIPNIESFLNEAPLYVIDFIDEPGLSIQTRAFRNHKEEALYLEEVFRKIGVKKFHIIGVSLGGWKAVNYAYYYPNRVASLILLDPVSVFSPLSKEIVFRYLGSLFKEHNMVEYLLNGQKIPQGNPFSKTIDMAMNDFEFGTAFPLGTRKKALKSLKCPVLALMAGKSPLHDSNLAVNNGLRWVKTIQIENWKDATHGFSFEMAKEVNKKIKVFLKRIEK